MWQIDRAKDILEHHGIRELTYRSGRYITNRYLKKKERTPYYKRRVDNEYRWSFIQPHLGNAKTSLDVGCAQGYFTNKMAEEGILTLGIDTDSDRLEYAKNEWNWKTNIGFANWHLNPDTIHHLPSCDALLLLCVYHHFVRYFGEESSKKMLRNLGAKTDIMACEMPADRLAGLSFNYNCTNINTGESYEVTDYQNSDGMRSKYTGKVRPDFKYVNLPSGNYELIADAEGYEESSSYKIEVGESGRICNRPRLRLEEGQIKVEHEEDESELTDVIGWYEDLFSDVFNDKADIVDKTLTEKKSYDTKRRDIVYIIDTSNVNK